MCINALSLNYTLPIRPWRALSSPNVLSYFRVNALYFQTPQVAAPDPNTTMQPKTAAAIVGVTDIS